MSKRFHKNSIPMVALLVIGSVNSGIAHEQHHHHHGPLHGPGSSHNPIAYHPVHGPGSSHNPIVHYPVHGPGSSHDPIVCPSYGCGGHHGH
jgi:hypothetical protein